MEKMVYKAIIRYLRKHYPSEMGTIIKRAKEILPELKAKAPDLGGRENSLANTLTKSAHYRKEFLKDAVAPLYNGDGVREDIDLLLLANMSFQIRS